MALSENGQHDAARPKIERSLAQNPANPWAAHATAHLAYEQGDPDAARGFLAAWLTTYPRNAPLYSHLSWHLALGYLEAGDAAAASRLFSRGVRARGAQRPAARQAERCGVVSVALGTRRAPRDAAAWRMMQDFANAAFPRAGSAFSDLHVALGAGRGGR